MKIRTYTSLAAGTLAAVVAGYGWGACSADAQTVATDTGLTPQTIVVTQRPLRTFRGEAVRVGRYAESEKSIGVVRPLREVPAADRRVGWSYGRGFGHGATPGRVILDTYRAPYPRFEKSIGVVRAYRTFDPVERHAPRTLTNPNARTAVSEDVVNLRPTTVGPTFGDGATSVVIAAGIGSGGDDARATDDPWVLLDRGRYREARERFEQLDPAEVGEAQWLTGRALAAAMSGDLAGGAALMPASPVVPESVRWSDLTLQRIVLIREYLYEGDPATQRALQLILDSSDNS